MWELRNMNTNELIQEYDPAQIRTFEIVKNLESNLYRVRKIQSLDEIYLYGPAGIPYILTYRRGKS